MTSKTPEIEELNRLLWSRLREGYEFLEAMETKYGKNMWRLGLRNMQDNGDGTVTLRRPIPYSSTKKDVG